MNRFIRSTLLAVMFGATIATFGCAVTRQQESVGEYVDDAVITSSVKAKFVTDKTVSASAIKVETLDGVVQLSGFAKSASEKSQAESLARQVKGVKSVQNRIDDQS